MMVLCNDIVIIEHARRRSGLPSASLGMEYNNNKKSDVPLTITPDNIFSYSHIHVHLKASGN